MSFWAFTIPFALCIIGIVGGIVLHFYAEWSGKREEARRERFWREHQTEWTDDLARRREMRERAEARMGSRHRAILIDDAERYQNRGTAV